MSRHTVLFTLVVFTAFGTSCGPGPTSLVPEDYTARFVRVRNCRPTVEHAGSQTSHISVFVNPESAEAYQRNANPLPAGTTVIKEEHDTSDCSHVVAWTVTRKEPGFDPSHGDWHWQRIRASNRTVEADGQVQQCIRCHMSCRARDWMCTEP